MEDQVQQLRDEGIAAGDAEQLADAPASSATVNERTRARGLKDCCTSPPSGSVPRSFQELMLDRSAAEAAGGRRSALHQPVGARFSSGICASSARCGRRLGSPPTHRADRDRDAKTCAGTSSSVWRCASRRIVITGFDRPTSLYESRRMNKVAEKDGRAARRCCGASREAASSIARRARRWMR